MDRNVRRVSSSASGADASLAGGAGGSSEPPPLEKLLKYFPAEALAFYSTLFPLVVSITDGDAGDGLLWGVLGLSVVFCAAFLWRFWSVESPVQILISCVALVVFVAGTGGPFLRLDWWKPGIAAILAVLMTAVMLFVPTPPQAPTADG